MKILNKTVSNILAILIILSAFLISACATDITGFCYGDINTDGKINVRDVTILQKYISGIIMIEDDIIPLCDVNRDGEYTVRDATTIQEYLASIENNGITGEKYPYTDNLHENKDADKLKITVGNTVFKAEFADNSSAQAFKEKLKAGSVTVNMNDYGNFEKVGSLGFSLPRNDEYITTEPGDIILYQGNQITIYYDTNSWNFTRLGKIENVTKGDLLSALGKGSATVTFSI